MHTKSVSIVVLPFMHTEDNSKENHWATDKSDFPFVVVILYCIYFQLNISKVYHIIHVDNARADPVAKR